MTEPRQTFALRLATCDCSDGVFLTLSDEDGIEVAWILLDPATAIRIGEDLQEFARNTVEVAGHA